MKNENAIDGSTYASGSYCHFNLFAPGPSQDVAGDLCHSSQFDVYPSLQDVIVALRTRELLLLLKE